MKFLTFAICLFISTCAFGQKQVKIKVVDDQTGEPLPGIYCKVLRDQDQFVNCGNTDDEGVLRFSISNFEPASTYQVEILNRRKNFVKSGRHAIFPEDENHVIKVVATDSSVPYTCSSISYPNYIAKEPYSLDELPDAILNKVRKILLGKVGEAFYERLQFNGGQLVDLDRYFKLNPEAEKKGINPYSYSLCFMVTAPDCGEHLYSFQMELDENGNLMKDLELPNIVNFPDKAFIMSLKDATILAKKMDLFTGRYNSKTLFDQKSGSMVHQFEILHPKGHGQYDAEKIYMDAHTGTVIRKEWIVVEIISD